MNQDDRIYIPPRTRRRESDAFFMLGFVVLVLIAVGLVSFGVWALSR